MLLRRSALALLGLTATSGQIILLREFISTFHGNELVIGIYLSVWLLSTAVGSGLVGRMVSWRSSSAQMNAESAEVTWTLRFAIVESLVGVSLLFALIGLSLPPSSLRPGPGEATGLLIAMACSGLFLTPFCLLQGLLFPLGTRLLRAEGPDASVSRVYLLEAVGAAVGGFLVSLVLVHLLSSFQNVAIICVLNMLMAGALFERASHRGLRHVCTLFAAAAVVVCVLDPVTLWITSRKWEAFDVVEVRQSRYGNLAVISLDSQFSVYQEGLLVFTTEDSRSAEETAHISLLQHPSPRDVLLIGGGIGGVVGEALKHKYLRQLDYVELDPELVALSRETLPPEYVSVLDDARLVVHLTDGRRFLRRTAKQYDVIIMQIPPPYTAQLNRFYTREFFALVRDHLASGSVFVFSAPGVAEYIGDDLGAFLASLATTSQSVFGRTVVIPAGRSFFVCSLEDNPYVTAMPESLLSRLQVRDLETIYVRDYFLLSSLSPERLRYVGERIEAGKAGSVNTDLKPISFYYDLILWSAEYERFMKKPLKWFFENSWSLWAAVLGVGGVLLTWGSLGRRRPSARLRGRLALSALAVSGFAAIVLELEIMLCFQLLFGGLYSRIGILLTSYMVGLALGTALERRAGSSGRRLLVRPAQIQMGTAVFAVCFLGIVYLAAGMRWGASLVLEWIFPLFAVVAGALGGGLFSSASRAFFGVRSSGDLKNEHGASLRESASRSMGLTYAWDLVGSWVGAAVCSAILFPVVGVASTTGMVAALLAASSLSLIAAGWVPKELG